MYSAPQLIIMATIMLEQDRIMAEVYIAIKADVVRY